MRQVLAEVDVTTPKPLVAKAHHYLNGVELPRPSSLKVIQYDGGGGFYLIGFDKEEKELQDTFHDSFEEALERAEWEFGIGRQEWSIPTDTILQQIERQCLQFVGDLGLRVVEEDVSESFGNSYVTLERRDVRLRIVRDRRLITAEVSPLSELRWWPVRMLGELLGAKVPEASRTAAPLCAYLRDNLVGIAKLLAGDVWPETRRRLEEVSARKIVAMRGERS